MCCKVLDVAIERASSADVTDLPPIIKFIMQYISPKNAQEVCFLFVMSQANIIITVDVHTYVGDLRAKGEAGPGLFSSEDEPHQLNSSGDTKSSKKVSLL